MPASSGRAHAALRRLCLCGVWYSKACELGGSSWLPRCSTRSDHGPPAAHVQRALREMISLDSYFLRLVLFLKHASLARGRTVEQVNDGPPICQRAACVCRSCGRVQISNRSSVISKRIRENCVQRSMWRSVAFESSGSVFVPERGLVRNESAECDAAVLQGQCRGGMPLQVAPLVPRGIMYPHPHMLCACSPCCIVFTVSVSMWSPVQTFAEPLAPCSSQHRARVRLIEDSGPTLLQKSERA